MSETVQPETKQNKESATLDNDANGKETANADTSTPNPNPASKTPKMKKKKKNTILYQETAIKYFNGFMKNKRYNKGINLSTSCSIFKTAWELPENNGLILPSRVVRHFKQVLPKKPKTDKAKNKTLKAKPTATTPNLDEMITKDTPTKPEANATEDNDVDILLRRSRTMQQMHTPVASTTHQSHQYNRTMMASSAVTQTNPTSFNTLIDKQNAFCDTIEAMIDEQKIDEDTLNTKKKHTARSKSIDNFSYDATEAPEDMDVSLKTDVYDDHADITKDDLKPDVEEQPVLDMRAETDISKMDADSISFREEMNKRLNEQTSEAQKPVKKKKKKYVLYAEDATKLFKKITDGKRFKNGITLKKACNIFSVAWELPEENGKLLPSKVARHFKQVLPSKKSIPKNLNKGLNNIRPSAVIRSKVMSAPSQTMRGHAVPHAFNENEKKDMMRREQRRTVVQLPSANQLVGSSPSLLTDKSVVSHLESLIAADPNRSNDEDHESMVKNERQRAGSLGDLNLDAMNANENENEHIIENEIEQLIQEKKNEQKKEQKKKDKEMDAANAIEASLGI